MSKRRAPIHGAITEMRGTSNEQVHQEINFVHCVVVLGGIDSK